MKILIALSSAADFESAFFLVASTRGPKLKSKLSPEAQEALKSSAAAFAALVGPECKHLKSFFDVSSKLAYIKVISYYVWADSSGRSFEFTVATKWDPATSEWFAVVHLEKSVNPPFHLSSKKGIVTEVVAYIRTLRDSGGLAPGSQESAEMRVSNWKPGDEVDTAMVRIAMANWFAMEGFKNTAKLILAYPDAKKFMSVRSKFLYRCVIVGKTGKIKPPETPYGFLTYSEDPAVPHKFFASLDVPAGTHYLIVKKKFDASALVLNFTAFAASLKESGGWNEKEIWMHATPYYKDLNNLDEVVFDSRKS